MKYFQLCILTPRLDCYENTPKIKINQTVNHPIDY